MGSAYTHLFTRLAILPRPLARPLAPPAENNLSFIETSALDASNVEQAFQNILTGTSFPRAPIVHAALSNPLTPPITPNLPLLARRTRRNLPHRLEQGPPIIGRGHQAYRW